MRNPPCAHVHVLLRAVDSGKSTTTCRTTWLWAIMEYFTRRSSGSTSSTTTRRSRCGSYSERVTHARGCNRGVPVGDALRQRARRRRGGGSFGRTVQSVFGNIRVGAAVSYSASHPIFGDIGRVPYKAYPVFFSEEGVLPPILQYCELKNR